MFLASLSNRIKFSGLFAFTDNNTYLTSDFISLLLGTFSLFTCETLSHSSYHVLEIYFSVSINYSCVFWFLPSGACTSSYFLTFLFLVALYLSRYTDVCVTIISILHLDCIDFSFLFLLMTWFMKMSFGHHLIRYLVFTQVPLLFYWLNPQVFQLASINWHCKSWCNSVTPWLLEHLIDSILHACVLSYSHPLRLIAGIISSAQ